jgi:hypothetical protein
MERNLKKKKFFIEDAWMPTVSTHLVSIRRCDREGKRSDQTEASMTGGEEGMRS